MDGDMAFARLWSAAYEAALADGLPLLRDDIEAATPVNAAPYVIAQHRFEADFGGTDRRRQLLGVWREGLADAAALGADPALAIVGGSFLDRRNHTPRDLDCAVFYDVHQSAASAATGLRALQHRMIGDGVDVRFMPGDQSRLFLAKSVGFFMLLYAQQRRPGAARAPLLIVPDTVREDR